MGTLRIHQRELDVTVMGELPEHVHHLAPHFSATVSSNVSVVSEDNEECVDIFGIGCSDCAEEGDTDANNEQRERLV